MVIDGKEYGISELEEVRKMQLDILSKDAGNADAACELVCADALLCEEYNRECGVNWRNAALCREIARYMPSIIELGDKLTLAVNVCARAADSLFDHPRLKLRLLMLQHEAVEARGGDEADDAEEGLDELSREIAALQLNIIAADQKRWNDITESGYLRHDPVEWTEAYEDVIAEAQQKADERLKDVPRGMGFCFAWWHELADILMKDYGIRWRSPGLMNPRVHFD